MMVPAFDRSDVARDGWPRLLVNLGVRSTQEARGEACFPTCVDVIWGLSLLRWPDWRVIGAIRVVWLSVATT